MKKFITITITLLLVLSACQSSPTNKLDQILAKKELIVVTSPDFAPYEFIDPTKSGQDQYVGADIALGKYIAEKLGVTLTIEAVDFSTVLASIVQGRADLAISGLGYKEDRAETMELSQPYNISEDNCHGLIIRKADVDMYTSMVDFTGKTVAAQNGSLQQGYVEKQIADVKIELITNLNDGILMLQTSKVDALATACTTGEQFAKSYDTLVMSTVEFDTTSDISGTVIGITKGETALLEKINEIIEEVVALGLYAKWEAEYIQYADELGIE